MTDFGWRGLLRALRFWVPRTASGPVPDLPLTGIESLDEFAVQLVGRDNSIEEISAQRAGTVVLAGNSGVGKTALATVAAVSTPGAPPPAALSYRQGSLQTVLFSSLAEALAIDAASRGSVERVGRIFGEAVRKVAGTRLEALAGAAQQVMVGVARDRLGDTVVDLTGDMVMAVNTTVDEQLVRRLTQACDPDAIAVFKEFAREAADLLELPVVLTLDTAEKMHEDDFAQLLDLTSDPSAAIIRVAIATRDDQAERRVRELRVAGAYVVEIEPLDDATVRDWLASVSIVGPTASDIVRTALGYPLFVVAAIEHVRNGRTVGNLRGRDGFVAQMEMNFHALDRVEQSACVAIAGFTDPPDLDTLTSLLGCTPSEWLVIEARLAERKIFPTAIDGRAWFHELGRRAIWESALSPAQRESSARSATDVILKMVERSKGSTLQEAVDLARLFPASPEAAAQHDGVQTVLGLSLNQLALYGALLELTEDQSPGLTPTAVVEHARQSFRCSGDLESQLRVLEELDLVALAENAQAAVVVGVWPSIASRIVLVGRVAEELGRHLLPSAASATFEHLLRPRIGQFHKAMFGVGDPDMTERSAALREMDFDRDSEAVEIHQRFGIMGRGRWGGITFHYAVSFDEAGDRALASDELEGYVEQHYFGDTFSIETVVSWPRVEPLPELRLVQGALQATAHHAGANLAHDLKGQIAPSSPSVGEHLRTKLKAQAVLRDMADPFTAEVLHHEPSNGYVYFEEGSSVLVAETRGCPSVIKIPAVPDPFAPFARTRMSTMAGLPHGASIGRMTLYSGGIKNDPVVDVLNDCRKRLKAFNDQQRNARKVLILDVPSLERELIDVLEGQSRVATAFLEEGLIADPSPIEPYRHLRLLIRPGKQEAGWVTGAHGSVTWTSEPADANRVDIEIATTSEPAGWGMADFRQRFDLQSTPDTYSHSVLVGGLGRLFGFGDTRVSIELPGS